MSKFSFFWNEMTNSSIQAKHFNHDHYMCQWRECLDKKFIVFDSDIDLKAHEVSYYLFFTLLSDQASNKLATNLRSKFMVHLPEGFRERSSWRRERSILLLSIPVVHPEVTATEEIITGTPPNARAPSRLQHLHRPLM